MWKNQRLNILAGLFAVVMTVLAVIGAIRMYSPIPHWDMWDGTLQFYLDTQDGIASAWWRQHNEHRVCYPGCFSGWIIGTSAESAFF